MANSSGNQSIPSLVPTSAQQAQTIFQPASTMSQFTCTPIVTPQTVAGSIELACQPSAAPLKQAPSAQNIILSGLVILTATASIVSASGSRQEALSGRIRALSAELRQLAAPAKDIQHTFVGKNRLLNIPRQLKAFRWRLRWAVRAHLALYIALAIEAFGFGVGFLAATMRELHRPALEQFAIRLAPPFCIALLLFLCAGLTLHIYEYRTSNGTMDIELEDIFGPPGSKLKPRSTREEKRMRFTSGYAKLIQDDVTKFLIDVDSSKGEPPL